MGTDKITDKIIKLIAKAEGTDNEAEAATFMAAAQRLMLEHAVEEGMLAKADPARKTRPITRNIDFGKNSTGIKALRHLLAGTAEVNRCKVWMNGGRRIMTIAGFEEDVDFVLMMEASIRVQMATALATAKKDPMAQMMGGQTFTVNFMYGYVSRVVSRLRANQRTAEAEVNVATGRNALPVLASRRQEVEAVVPATLRKGPAARNRVNGTALAAGGAAGERADISGGRNRIGATGELGR